MEDASVTGNSIADELPPTSSDQLPTKEQIQILKLREANNKYKSLLKMAKERIQAQEEELEKMQSRISELEEAQKSGVSSSNNVNTLTENRSADEIDSILRICQRIKIQESSKSSHPSTSNNNSETNKDSEEEIWALVEYETNPEAPTSYRRYKKWESFTSESKLSDFIRRDAGEPLSLPPYSLTPKQSESIQHESQKAVANITEEFRRFRVRSEVARKQADATVRALHSNNVVTTRAKIHGQDLENELQQARTDHAQLASLQRELAEQDSNWKDAYRALLAENKALKSSGAEALLATQWRQRYETCRRKNQDLETNFKTVQEQMIKVSRNNKANDAGKYALKYRDLKESFRLYRKKAKEIFGHHKSINSHQLVHFNSQHNDDVKMLYIRNLMINYIKSDPSIRRHMEGAINTLLKLSEDEIIRADTKEKKKKRKRSNSGPSLFQGLGLLARRCSILRTRKRFSGSILPGRISAMMLQ